MLKITSQLDPAREDMSLVLEGRLAGPWVEELRTYCRQILGTHQRCTMIDLTGVTFVDAEGKALLAQLWQQGVELQASGCLIRCLVEDITKAGRTACGGPHGSKRLS